MICTFGLINRGKGLEYMIQAMPRIVAACPEAVYLIVGATHPQVKRQEGEVYRESLVEMAEVAGRRRARALREQVSQPRRPAGALAGLRRVRHALSGKGPDRQRHLGVCLGGRRRGGQHPYLYAEEVLADGRGLLVPFGESDAMADATLRFLGDTAFQVETRRRAYEYARPMFWPNVGRQYLEFFTQVASGAEASRQRLTAGVSPPGAERDPANSLHGGIVMHVGDRIALNHLDRMTDSTGLIQHAIYSIPRRESGYTTDDNARALRLCARLWGQHPDERMLSRVTTYLSFLEHARGPAAGSTISSSYQRRWLDAEGTGDCQGQAVRALAEVLGSSLPDGYRALARELIDAVLPTLADLRSLRAQAYVILAWGHLWTCGVQDIEPLESVAWSAAQRLVECYHRSRAAGLAVVRVAHDLCERGVAARPVHCRRALAAEEDFLDVAETSFAFLDRATTADGVFWPVGNSGWYPHGEEKAPYDQQPVEAVTMADAALAGLRICSATTKYLATFRRAHAWFHGQNSLHRAAGRCPVAAPAATVLQAVRRESEPGSGIDARLLVDGTQQYGTAATISDNARAAIASVRVRLKRKEAVP